MRKKMFSILLAMALAISLLPTSALAANASSVYVGGVELTDAAPYCVNGAASATSDPTDYNAYFDAAAGTLTLNNYAYSGAGHSGAAIYADGDLNIVLEGGSSVTQSRAATSHSAGVYVTGSLTVSGSGSLIATGGAVADGGKSYGLYGGSGVSITGGVVVARAGMVGASYGGDNRYAVYAENGNINVDSASAKIAGAVGYKPEFDLLALGTTGLTADTKAIGADGAPATGVVIVPSGWMQIFHDQSICDFNATISANTAYITGGEKTLVVHDNQTITVDPNVTLLAVSLYEGSGLTEASGISCDASATLSVGGSIIAVGGMTAKSGGMSNGIYSAAGLTVSGSGSILAAGGAADSSSGVYCADGSGLGISGGTVTAIGGTATGAEGKSYGVYGKSSTGNGLRITSGTVTAIGGEATGAKGKSYGVCGKSSTGDGLRITSGTVTAIGGAAPGDESKSYGVYGEGGSGDGLRITGGTVTATGGAASMGNCGVLGKSVSGAAVCIEDGKLTATGGTCKWSTSYGVCGEYNSSVGNTAAYISIKGGVVTATGGTMWNSQGIGSAYGITIEGGTVTAVGGWVRSLDSCGIYATSSVTIKGNAAVTATGGATDGENALAYSAGILPGGGLDISGSATVTATGGAAAKAPSYGIFCVLDGGGITISGGTVKAQSGAAMTEIAMNEAPDLTGSASYKWRLSDSGQWSTEAYAYDAAHSYLGIEAVPGAPPAPGGGVVIIIPTSYLVTEGAGEQWAPGGEDGLDFTCNGLHNRFTGVQVDGVTIRRNIDYTDRSGSTIVTLTPAYLATLHAGEHTLRVNFTDGFAESPFFVGEWENPYADVGAGDWFYEDVLRVYARGLMQGTDKDKFDPEGTTTRGMIVAILWRLDGEPAVSGSCPFGDVKSDSYYEDAITWATANKIVDGYGNGRFGPDDPITREQLAAILWRYAQYKGYDVSVGEDTNILSYEDAETVSEYAIGAMQWACGAGIIEGDKGNLMPTGGATRAQAAAMLMRFLSAVGK